MDFSATIPVANPRLTVSTLGIHDIPVEIFNHVLSFLRDVDPPGRYDKAYLGWLDVTFVSQSWRVAALSNHSLWTRIPLDVGKTWPRVFVERSHPLPIEIDLNDRPIKDWEDLVTSNYRRIRSLEVDYNDYSPADYIYDLIAQPSEELETLILHRVWRELESPRIRPQQCPRLHTLHLVFGLMRGEFFPWRGIASNAGLTELKIHIKRHMDDDWCLEDIVHTLGQLPDLVTFELKLLPRHLDDGDIYGRADHSPVRDTYLSKLEHMTLECDAEMILRVLDRVTFPMSVETTLVSLYPVALTAMFAALLPWISARSTPTPPKRLSFVESRNERTQMDVARSSELGRGVYLRLELDPVMKDAFPHVLHSLVPDAIRVVDIATLFRFFYDRDGQLLSHLSSTCHNVACITIIPGGGHNASTMAGLIIAILRRLLLPVADTTDRPPFPRLSVLDLAILSKEIVSARCMHPEDSTPYRVMPPTLAESLVDIVKARRDIGGNMPRVYLREWIGPISRFEEDILNVARTIPNAEFLPEGSRVPLVDEVLDEVM